MIYENLGYPIGKTNAPRELIRPHEELHLITITTRKKRLGIGDLEPFFASMKLVGTWAVVPEYHNQPGKHDQLHYHGFYKGDDIKRLGELKRQSRNKFQIHYAKPKTDEDIARWTRYCRKAIQYTMKTLAYDDMPQVKKHNFKPIEEYPEFMETDSEYQSPSDPDQSASDSE